MKRIHVSILVMFLFSGILAGLLGQEQDYNRLFRTLKSFMGPADLSKVHAQPIESNAEIKSVMESGLNSINLIAPYSKGQKDLKSMVKELSNYHFTLRSAKNAELYKKAVHSTVLIIAPDIGSGAGYVIDKDRGLIVTNFHVTSGLKNLLVAFYDENIQDPTKIKFISASVVKYSAKRDIAVLKLSTIPSNVQQLYFSQTGGPAVGESVHTIGHPMSLTWTYSSGLITALRSHFQFGQEEIADVIQIDASISPGNSGGPLMDEDGNLIGMITFSSGAQNAQNLNFALSAKEIKDVLTTSGNEDTAVSKGLQKLAGLNFPSLNQIGTSCKASNIDADGDGKVDYISFRDSQTNKEMCQYYKGVEYESETGKKQKANLLSWDINNDGVVDALMVDVNLDNKFELLLVDINGDGEPDIVGADPEGKGSITEAWIID